MAVNRVAGIMVRCNTEHELINAFGYIWNEAEDYGKFYDFEDTYFTHYDGWTICSSAHNALVTFVDDKSDASITFTKTGEKYSDIKFNSTDALPKWMKVEF